MGKNSVFIKKDKLTTINNLYSFYNLKGMNYYNLELNMENFKELEKYDQLIIFNPTIEEIKLISLMKDLEAVLIFTTIDLPILNHVKKIEEYKILIINPIDKLFLENNKINNFYLINPVSEITAEQNTINELEEKKLNLLNCFSSLLSTNFDDIKILSGYNKNYNLVYRGLKEVINNFEYLKLKELLSSKSVISSFPLLNLRQNVIDSSRILSVGNDFPIEILYYLKYKEDGEIFYHNRNKLSWFDQSKNFKENKQNLEKYISKTRQIEEVL